MVYELNTRGADLSTALQALINADKTTLLASLGAQPLAAPLTATTAGYTTAEQSKLAGVAPGATSNSTDAILLARANHTGTELAAVISDFNSAADARVVAGITGKENLSAKNAVNGYCGLDGTGKVAAAQLPAYVDDVLEFTNLASFPVTGSSGIIYVDDATGKIYRWSGSVYIEISPSPGSTDSVAEGSVNLYFTPARVIAAPLTGFAAAGTRAALIAADTVLGAFGKVQKYLTDLAPVAFSGLFSDIGSKPTTRAGYGITDAQPLATVLTNTTASYTTTEQTKLAGVATGATANSTDAILLARANHTGTELAAVISDFSAAADARVVLGITGKQDLSGKNAASGYVGLDANSNSLVNNARQGYATTATAGGTTVLTVASPYLQFVTGTLAQIIQLPDVTTLNLGHQFYVRNNSTGLVTINSSGGSLIRILGPQTRAMVTCLALTGATAASWSTMYLGIGIADGKVLSANNSLTLAGTDGTVMTFPATNSTIPSNAAVSSGAAGLAPASGGGTTNFLRADSTWAAAPAATPTNVQEFSTVGTTAWVKPAGAVSVEIELVGGGGGGGAGSNRADMTTAAGGGAGGGAGGRLSMVVPASYLGSSETVVIGGGGAGGTGGTGITGGTGANGTTSSFATFTARNGAGGTGGSTVGGTGGLAGGAIEAAYTSANVYAASGGGGGNGVGTAGNRGGVRGGGGGGGGGWAAASTTLASGGTGGLGGSAFTGTSTGSSSSGGAPGTVAGGAGVDGTGSLMTACGQGAGGGANGGTGTGPGGAGGAGGDFGGGGGGGGASTTSTSPNGGAGGKGFLRVTTYF